MRLKALWCVLSAVLPYSRFCVINSYRESVERERIFSELAMEVAVVA